VNKMDKPDDAGHGDGCGDVRPEINLNPKHFRPTA
jgi:hypothetical protein